MKQFTIALTAFLFTLNGCNNSACRTEDKHCNVGPLKRLFEEFFLMGDRGSSIHYVLVSDYNGCCSGKIDYMSLASHYKDTSASKYTISEIIFVKSEETFWSDEMMPDDDNLFRTGLARIEYHYQDSLVGKATNDAVSFYSY